MRRLFVIGGCSALVVVFALPALASGPAPHADRRVATICVGSGPGCARTIQAALDKARPGDVVAVGRGTFAGGITIRKSVSLVGAGAGATIVKGGGPVVTITPSSSRVSIARLTITGGLTTTDQTRRCGADIPTCGPGYVRATALGGGVEIAPATLDGPGQGATVTISDSVVTGNRAEPRVTVPSVVAKCPGGPCPFAQAGGGGIDNWGTLTLVNTTVSNNAAAGRLTAQADGGGILSEDGSRLTLQHSSIRGNRAAAANPKARLAAGGGIYVFRRGVIEAHNSAVSGNSAVLESDLPDIGDEMYAHSGGIYVANGGSATIDHVTFSENNVTVRAPNGRAAGFDSALFVWLSPLTLTDSVIRGNSVDVQVATSRVGGSGGGLEADTYAVISRTQVSGNRVTLASSSGRALAVAVVNMFVSGPRAALFSDSVISGNSVRASSTNGTAQIQGVGLANNGPLELHNVRITDNTGSLSGPDGWAHGGGIFNGLVYNVPKPKLTLDNVSVTGNRLGGSHGLPIQGAGLYSAGFPILRSRTAIEHNAPDDCYGCR